MPEGDTIFRTAVTLRRALLGQEIVTAEAPSSKSLGRWSIVRVIGSTVEAVKPRGKHLMIRFSNRLALHTHMQISASWHLYRPGERWRRPQHPVRVVLRTAEFEAVCFTCRSCSRHAKRQAQQNLRVEAIQCIERVGTPTSLAVRSTVIPPGRYTLPDLGSAWPD